MIMLNTTQRNRRYIIQSDGIASLNVNQHFLHIDCALLQKLPDDHIIVTFAEQAEVSLAGCPVPRLNQLCGRLWYSIVVVLMVMPILCSHAHSLQCVGESFVTGNELVRACS